MTRRVRAARGRLARRGGRRDHAAACASASDVPARRAGAAVRRDLHRRRARARSASSASPARSCRAWSTRIDFIAELKLERAHGASVGQARGRHRRRQHRDRLRDAGARARRRGGHARLPPRGRRRCRPTRTRCELAREVGCRFVYQATPLRARRHGARRRHRAADACGSARRTRRGGARPSRSPGDVADARRATW